jgi:hypothetical protein
MFNSLAGQRLRMSDRTTTRRILDQLGEDETLLSTDYTAADLKLLIPGLLLAVFIIGLMPAGLGLVGFALGGLVMLGTVGLIWYAPPHRVAHKWVADVVNFQIRNLNGETLVLPHDTESEPDASRTLTHVETVLRRWNSVERVDGAIVGAMRVHPANMALADASDWETASDALAEFLRSISFDVQIYSTARPVDASQIVAPYRDRLHDSDVRDNDRLRGVIRAYRDTLPEEFERRRTSVREYYVLVAVSELDAQLANQGMMDTLRDAPVIGRMCAVIGAGRSDFSDGEVLVRQQRELNTRLASVRRGITELPECKPEPVTAARVTDLLEEYWTGQPSHYADNEAGSLRFHDMPIIRPDPERDPETSETDSSTTEQVATDGGTASETPN